MPMPMPSTENALRAALSLGLLIATPAADAQGRVCAPHDEVAKRLGERYGETVQSMGMHQSGGLVEIYASEGTGTWTILVTMPDGQACLLAAGEMWEAHSTPAIKPGKDT